MDKLKDFIDKNREAFNEVSLPEGYMERFGKKLGRKRAIRRFSLCCVSVAACAGLFLFLKIQSEPADVSLRPSHAFACEAGEEIEGLRLYYSMQAYDVEAQIKELCAGRQTQGSVELIEETARVIRTTYDFEEKILPSLPCSEAGIFAMSQLYGNSLRSLNFMLEQMEQLVDNNHHN
jgi:hypothetical protein